MAKRKIYGKTWWGKKWIEAMEKIDFNTNRLPRGRTYANKGLVLEVRVNRNSDIVARVQGTRATPYKEKISLIKFPSYDVEIIGSILSENPYIAGQLLNGILPEELYEIFQKEGIKLFPESWDDIEAYCSCPDWANPCKHLAAVYYVIANEIDKDPFLLFEMHGLKKKKLLELAKISSEKSKNVLNFLPINSEKNELVLDEKIALEEPFIYFENIEEIISLLSEKTIFSDFSIKDFLNDLYGQGEKYVKNIKILEENLYLKDTEFKIIYSLQNPDILIKGYNPFSKEIIKFEDLFNLMYSISFLPDKNDNEYSFFFKKVLGFVFNIIMNHSFAPKPEIIESDKFYVKYMPLISNSSFIEYLDYLEKIIPDNLVIYLEKNKVLKKSDAVIYIISLVIKEIVKKVYVNKKMSHNILSVFSEDKLYPLKTLEEKNIANSLENYFEPLFFKSQKYTLAIKIMPFIEDRYYLSLLVKDNSDVLSEPISLTDFLKNKKYFNEKANILKQIGFISNLSNFSKTIMKHEDIIITSSELSTFFNDVLPALNVFGIDVILPKEMKKIVEPKVVIQAKRINNTTSFFNLNDLLRFDWKIAIGDQIISAEEFRKLLEKSEGIIKFKDMYIHLNPKKFLNILKKLEKPIDELSNYESLRVLLSEEYNGIPLYSDNKLKNIIDEMKKIKNIRIPKTLNAEMREYQKRGYKWLKSNVDKGFGVCLADDMGLGKTIQTIAVVLKDKENKNLNEPALVVCPTTLIGNWATEIEKFAPKLKYHIYHGNNRDLKNDSDIILTSYGVIRRDIEKLEDLNWSYIILDEAQNIKNPLTKQTKAVKKLKGKKRIALTGTPVENRLLELWSIFDFLMPGYLGNYNNFIKNYAIPIEKYNDKTKLKAIKKAINPFLLRRLKTDKNIIKDLPEKIIFDQYVYLTPIQTSLYNKTVEMVNEISNFSGIERKGLIFKLITSLKQICNHPANYLKNKNFSPEESGKTQKLLDLLTDIFENNEKAIIFTQYKEMGEILEDIIKKQLKVKTLFFHGNLPRKKRDEMVEKFQTSHDYPVIIISLKAGGTGLNLTAASHVIHFDLWWNPAVEAQATDRAYRIGQKNNVIVHRFITKNTFEEKINEIIQKKKNLSNNILSIGEKWISELSDDELREIFKI
ncbi:DEAD/DEAH box helicase [Marinitoga aeolica]|uniref:DEAD/DEAH box helicase family protein n=1 Tax=Marinitoga aeolica TaxID=2809031 RepID=A0ABY8PQ15_9BACT|nr:DEAD/DEAH box helicase [Marinitoga aeolica]WGS64707.1 DEAD/DEAH box helicase family protein [Marinitoga aeolica]